jgi:hypothetical protein
VAHRGNKDRQARRAAEGSRIYKNRLKLLGAIGLATVAAGAAGGGRLLVQDIERGAHDAASNRVEAVNGAFSNPNQAAVTGEPSLSDAERTAAANRAHNANVEAAKAAEAAQSEEVPQ